MFMPKLLQSRYLSPSYYQQCHGWFLAFFVHLTPILYVLISPGSAEAYVG